MEILCDEANRHLGSIILRLKFTTCQLFYRLTFEMYPIHSTMVTINIHIQIISHKSIIFMCGNFKNNIWPFRWISINIAIILSLLWFFFYNNLPTHDMGPVANGFRLIKMTTRFEFASTLNENTFIFHSVAFFFCFAFRLNWQIVSVSWHIKCGTKTAKLLIFFK